MTRVTIQDLRTARYCLAGVRPWFRRHGLNWKAFLETGIAAERLRATGDALVEPVIQAAETRKAKALAPEPAVTSEPVQSPTTREAGDGR